jgi:hypothetical protein
MTNIFNYYGNSSCNSITLQPLVDSIPSSLVSQSKKSTLIFKTSSSHTEPSSLLVKRRHNTELGELLAKKIKTLSTNVSENGSNQPSPTIDRNSDYNMSDSRMTIEDSYQQVQQALEMLQKKLLIEQELSIKENPVKKQQQSQESLSIPPFLSSFSNFNEKRQNGKNSRKMEDELEVVYGEVEFPFLSISTPLNNIENVEKNAGFQFPNFSQANKTNKKSKGSSILSKLPSRLAALIDDDEDSEASFITDMRDSLTATRTATQRSDSEMGVAAKETMTKKSLRITEEGKKEHKKKAIARTIEPTKMEEKLLKRSEGKEKTINKQEENIYSLPASQRRRQRERRLNRWQLNQSDKLSNDGSSS